jgi:hypothetical protein
MIRFACLLHFACLLPAGSTAFLFFSSRRAVRAKEALTGITGPAQK